MPRKLDLTWHKQLKRWRKRYNGKDYYFAFGAGKHDREGYLQALDAWQVKKAELDEQAKHEADRSHEPDYLRIIPRWQKAVRGCLQRDEPHDLRICAAVLSHLQEAVECRTQSLADPSGFDIDYWDEAHTDQLRRFVDELNGTGDEVPTSRTIGGNVARFLKEKREQCERGEISAGRYDVIRLGLEDFERFAGKDKPIDSVKAPQLIDYRAYLLDAKAKKGNGRKIAAHTARDRIQCVKQFLNWCFECGSLENLPRPLVNRSKTLVIKTPPKRIHTLPLDYVRRLIAEANPRGRLYYYLMLNCGMYPVDIAELRQSEMNWKEGLITRKRSKTNKHENVPTVTYKLWPETLALLKAERSKDKELVLTNANGLSLRRETLGDDGKMKRTNAIKLVHVRLCKRLKVPCREIKGFRKTAASKLGEHEAYGRYAQYFLGQSPRTVADQSYVKPTDEAFFKALAWLREGLLMAAKPRVKAK